MSTLPWPFPLFLFSRLLSRDPGPDTPIVLASVPQPGLLEPKGLQWLETLSKEFFLFVTAPPSQEVLVWMSERHAPPSVHFLPLHCLLART